MQHEAVLTYWLLELSIVKTHETLHENVNENMFLCKFSCICKFAIFLRIYRSKKLGMIYTIFEKFSLIFGLGRGRYSAPNQA